MLCVTVTPTSRTLAKADLLNAQRQGDVVELCLDHLVKEPDVKDLIGSVDKPLIISCRRPCDGGHWQGTEEQRLLLLRQAIVAGPQYIELDLDIASQVPRFGKTQRLISFTRMDRPETDIDVVFDEAATAHADVVKFTWPTPHLQAAWPLLAAVSQRRRLPVVGMGLGLEELTFSLLGLKYGSPWVYAALERGMEAHPGQSSVFDLRDIYRCQSVNAQTQFIGVSGFGPMQVLLTQRMNQAFQETGLNVCCLPLALGGTGHVKKMLQTLKIRAILLADQFRDEFRTLIESEAPDQQSADLLIYKNNRWHGRSTLLPAAVAALERTLQECGRTPQRQNCLILGSGALSAAMATELVKWGGPVSLCGPHDQQTKATAANIGARFVPFRGLYDALADVIVIADQEVVAGVNSGQVNPSLFRPQMTVADFSDQGQTSAFLDEARERGCTVVDAEAVKLAQRQTQFTTITGKSPPDSLKAIAN